MAKQLSELTETTVQNNDDIILSKNTSGIDRKIQFLNFVNEGRQKSTKVGNYTILDADRHPILYVDSSGGDITITLPTLADNQNKLVTVVKTVAANNVIIDGEGAETINGELTYTLFGQYEYLTLIGLSSSWFIIGGGLSFFETGQFVAPDITLSGGTVTQRVLYCRNLQVTANTTLNAFLVICEGDLIIDSGITLTIGTALGPVANQATGGFLKKIHGLGAPTGVANISGGSPLGALGGAARHGGTSLAEVGGQSAGGAIGTPFDSNYNCGGAGGNSSDGSGGGGGAGPCAGGGVGNTASAGAGGDGGTLIFFLIRGNFNNQGTIDNNGENGAVADNRGGGGGGGGATIIIAYGATYAGGTINCEGGNGGSTGSDGGGGGGGHIEIYAKTSSFGTLSVAGGTGPGLATDGATGTTITVDIDTNPESSLGGEDADDFAGFFLREFLGIGV